MAVPMIRVLVLIAITGFFVGVLSIAAAVGVGGPELAARHGHWNVDWWDDDSRPNRRNWEHSDKGDRDSDSPAASRELAWDGASQLVLDVPADVEFTQTPGVGSVTIRGPKDVIDKVTLSGGRLSFDDFTRTRGRLSIKVAAPAVARFEVNGDDRLDIRNYKQDKLDLSIHGSSEVEVAGEARAVTLDIAGSGEADLGKVEMREATVDISGSGEATLAPKDVAILDISGSGEVNLLSSPPKVQLQVSGSGHVNQSDGSELKMQSPEPAEPEAPRPPTKRT